MDSSLVSRRISRFELSEIANQWTHAIGFVLSLPAGWWVVRAAAERGNDWLTSGCWVYAVTQSLLYAASTLSHSFRRGIWRHRFRTIDQLCIFLVIAGSYTPFGVTYLREGWGGALLIAMWCMAVIGIALKLVRTRLHGVATWFYLLMGWIPVVVLPQFFRCFGWSGLLWMFAGGASYSIGTWFLAQDQRRVFYHAVWHLLVILGSVCHFVLMLNYIVGCA